MPEPTLEATLLRKATNIGPDPLAQSWSDHPIRSAITNTVAPGVDPRGERPSIMDVLMAAVPFVGRAMKEGNLAMDVASRMQRAKDMGYTTDVYHGARDKWLKPDHVTGDIREFNYHQLPWGDAGIHVAEDPEIANTAVKTGLLSENQYAHHANVMPLKAKIQNPLELPDMNLWRNPKYWEAHLANVPPDTPNYEVVKELHDAAAKMAEGTKLPLGRGKAAPEEVEWPQMFKNILKRHGFDSVKYENEFEYARNKPKEAQYSYMLLDPSQLRSRFAAFDPARAKSGDILASILAAAGLGTAAATPKKDQQ